MKFNKVGKNKEGYPEVSGRYVVVYDSNLVSDIPYNAKLKAFNCCDEEDEPTYEITGVKGWYPKEAFLAEIDMKINKEYEEDDAL